MYEDIFNEDFERAEVAKDFGAVKPGIAHVRVLEVTDTKSSKGNPLWRVSLEITNPETLEPVDPNLKVSGRLTHFQSLVKEAYPFLKRFMTVLGVTQDDIRNGGTATLVGREADVYITVDEEGRNKVSKFLLNSSVTR